MKIRKAVITAAGPGQRTLPLQSLVDRDGTPKTALTILLQEALNAGIETIGIVISPGEEAAFASAAGDLARHLEFIPQLEPLGYGHAVACAHGFTGSDPFLLMVGDHIYVSNQSRGCARQLIEIAATENCSVSAVQATHESKLRFYGAVGGKRVPASPNIYEINEVLEKPTPTEAEQRLIVPGLRNGHYLCFFGMHVLSAQTMKLLHQVMETGNEHSTLQLPKALAQLAASERYLACEVDGFRYDLGLKYGLLTAQIALAMAGEERNEVLIQLMELIVRTTTIRS